MQLELAHIGVMRGTGNAAVGSQAGKDQRFCTQKPEQRLKRRLIKGRMHWLKHEIVVIVGLQQIDKIRSFCPRGETSLYKR